ncbi:MAG: UrcA family protein [Acetobacteraceae bacterium]|nr:UrcA family protein [Acetobacteraceae bacterium]
MNANIKTANRPALVLSTALLVACAWLGSPAFADDARSENVKFQDLNVNTPEGVQALYSRIHAAAKRVCREEDPMFLASELSCVRKAEEQAIAKTGVPQLQAYYRSKTGAPAQLIAGR